MTEFNSNLKNSITVKSLMFLLFIFFVLPMSGYAQNIIKGTVVDGRGEALPGVTIVVKGSHNGTITGVDGTYNIHANPNDILSFSYIGMALQVIKIAGKNVINVTMQDNISNLDEVVVVGYGTQKRGSVTGAVSTVSDKEMLKAPTMSLSNIVGSRVAGISAVQSSGQPGSDNAALKVRGQDGIIYVIDGIRRTSADFNGLDPNEIESVSVLKDASAVAVYGLDANGAFIVTTKKGKNEKMSIIYTGSVGMSENANQQKWLDGPGYAYWYNKARELDGDSQVFTSEMVQKMKDGVDGWGNTNWYDKVFGTGSNQHHNVSASGGNEKMHFFASIGSLKEKGNIDKYNYDRLNLRSNIDAKLTKSLTFALGISGRIEKRDSPRYSADPNDWLNVPQQVIRALPYVPETMDYEGTTYYVSTPTDSSPVNPLASIYQSGYSRSHRSYIQSNFSLKYDAPWLKGLSVKFQGAYDLTYNFNKALSIPYKAMIMNLPNANTSSLTYYLGNDAAGINTTLTESSSRAYDFTTQTSVNYDRIFGKHTINAMFLAETRENKSNAMSASGSGLDFIQLDELDKITNQTGNGTDKIPTIGGYSGQTRVAGFVGRINYSYDDKYLLEASLRHDGSYLFGGMNKRWITLPGLSLGWRMNNEKWFNVSWINNLKIRGSIGKTATSGVSAFQWRNTMASSANEVIIGGSSQSIVYAAVLGNPNLTWAQCLNYNFGFDATMWNGLLGMEFDVFYKYEWDKLSTVTGSYPPSMGGYYFTSSNANKADYKGFDLTFTHHNKIGNFAYGAKLIWSYSYGRWLKYSGDAENTPDYLKLTGKQIGAKKGFIAQGLFQSEEDIANSPTITGSAVLPGYIKYADRNGDGVISYAQDMGYVGNSSTPKHTGSLDLFGNWKGFDFDMLFAWGLGHDIALTGIYTSYGSEGIMDNTAYTKVFYHGGNSPTYLAEGSWTPENPNAEFPRLSLVNVSSNNAYSSTFWYRKGDYLRLKTMQIGYNVSRKLLNNIGVEGFRIYVEGYNLLTFSGLTKYNIDPESPAVNNGYYPQQRTYSLGVKLTF
ncbi:MAG: TonB-dependent Receptor Plug Domain protein [Bacteroidetes bacterium]|nr:TonB-dependent Receptor Plug Domain protein [Bacteroidota bacterium]